MRQYIGYVWIFGVGEILHWKCYMLLVGRRNQMFYNVFMATLCPGKSNEPRFNTRWPPGLCWENVSDVSSFYWTFTFSTWKCSKCKCWIHYADFKSYKTHQVSWDINNEMFGSELFGMINHKLKLLLVNFCAVKCKMFERFIFTKYPDVFVLCVIWQKVDILQGTDLGNVGIIHPFAF